MKTNQNEKTELTTTTNKTEQNKDQPKATTSTPRSERQFSKVIGAIISNDKVGQPIQIRAFRKPTDVVSISNETQS